jgi:hypothetical protein
MQKANRVERMGGREKRERSRERKGGKKKKDV